MAKNNLLGANRAAEARLQNVAIDRTALAMTPAFGRALANQMREAAKGYVNGNAISGAVLSNSDRLVEAYVTAYKRSSKLVAPRVLQGGKSLHGRDIIIKADEGGVPVLQYWNRTVAQWIEENAAIRVTQVNQTTINQLQNIIASGTEEGLNTLEIQQRIFDSVESLSMIRARAIARTEVHAGSQASSLKAAEVIGIDTVKEWNAIEDSRTRPDHLTADGQQVDLTSSFDIGGSSMAHPGDPSAPAKQVVNCRCVMDYPVM